MTEYFVKGVYSSIEIDHVRMAFSDRISDVGKCQFRKIFHLFYLIILILWKRVISRTDVIYYPPCGPHLVPFIRDCIILISTRWAFRYTIFHFHAAGLFDLYGKLGPLFRIAFRKAYQNPELALVISTNGIRDAEAIGAKKVTVVPNGVPDEFFSKRNYDPTKLSRILFLGVVSEEKGVGVLIQACHLLKKWGFPFECQIGGLPRSISELQDLKNKVQELNLETEINFVGHVDAEKRERFFLDGDIFCFPTFYTSESFGLVVVEAMMFELPVVVSRWRALPEIVDEGVTGFLASPKNAEQVAKQLASLILNPELKKKMGKAARTKYECTYRLDVFLAKIEAAISAVKSSITQKNEVS